MLYLGLLSRWHAATLARSGRTRIDAMYDAEWLRYWRLENIKLPACYDDRVEARSLAIKVVGDAKRDGVSIKAALADEGYTSAEHYVLDALNARIERETGREG